MGCVELAMGESLARSERPRTSPLPTESPASTPFEGDPWRAGWIVSYVPISAIPGMATPRFPPPLRGRGGCARPSTMTDTASRSRPAAAIARPRTVGPSVFPHEAWGDDNVSGCVATGHRSKGVNRRRRGVVLVSLVRETHLDAGWPRSSRAPGRPSTRSSYRDFEGRDLAAFQPERVSQVDRAARKIARQPCS